MPRVLVVNTLDASVSFYDATTRKRLKTVKVGASPQDIALARNGKYGYVTNASDGTISVLDVIRMSETQRLQADRIGDPYGVAVLPDGRSLFVTSSSTGQAAILDAQSGAVRQEIDLGANATAAFAVSPAGDRVWLADPAGGLLLGVDPRSGNVERTALDGNPGAVAIARDGRTLLVALREPARLVKLDPGTKQVNGNTAEVGSNPAAVCAHPYADQAFVLAKGGGSVFVVDLETMTAGRPISVGLGPSDVAVARAGKVLYVTNSESDSVSVVDVAKGTVHETWETGHHPSAVAFLS